MNPCREDGRPQLLPWRKPGLYSLFSGLEYHATRRGFEVSVPDQEELPDGDAMVVEVRHTVPPGCEGRTTVCSARLTVWADDETGAAGLYGYFEAGSETAEGAGLHDREGYQTWPRDGSHWEGESTARALQLFARFVIEIECPDLNWPPAPTEWSRRKRRRAKKKRRQQVDAAMRLAGYQ